LKSRKDILLRSNLSLEHLPLNTVGDSTNEWIKAIKNLAAGVIDVQVGPKVGPGHCINEGDSRTEEKMDRVTRVEVKLDNN
jgi:hypothetical protein